MVSARAFKPLPLCSAPLKTVQISGALGMKIDHKMSVLGGKPAYMSCHSLPLDVSREVHL